MANFTWTWDAPTGVWKNHELSKNVRYAAIAQTKFMQFVAAEPGYGKRKGESITIQRISNMDVPTSGRISESTRIPEDTVSLSTIAITVTEWGRAVPYTSFAQDLSVLDLENIVQRKLKDQMALVMDAAAAAAFKTGQIDAVPLSVGSIQFDTAGAPTAQGQANLNVFHVEEIRDYMFSTLLVPPYEGDDYVCLCSTKAKRGVMRDPAWEPWQRYTDPQKKFNSEVGRLENTRFVEINHGNALSGAIGNGGVQGEAVFFGADAIAMAVALDPELRAKQPEDYGRQKGVAWYGILEFGIIWDTANAGEARIVHFSST